MILLEVMGTGYITLNQFVGTKGAGRMVNGDAQLLATHMWNAFGWACFVSEQPHYCGFKMSRTSVQCPEPA